MIVPRVLKKPLVLIANKIPVSFHYLYGNSTSLFELVYRPMPKH